MSASRGAIPRVAWVAVGVAAGAAATTQGVPAALPFVAGLLALAARWAPGIRADTRPDGGVGDGCRGAAARVAGPRRPRGHDGAAAARGRGAVDRAWSSPSDRRGTATRSLGCACWRTAARCRSRRPCRRSRPSPRGTSSRSRAGSVRRRTTMRYGAYLRRSGASGTLDAKALTLVRASPMGLQTLRDASGDALQRALPEPEAGLAAGILVGLRERVDRALAADFATAGVSHVVAISGWNIAIVAALVAAVLRGRSRRLLALGILLTVVAYVVAAGASSSVVRAAVMAGVVLLARESGRAGRAPAALGIAAAVLLLSDPDMIGDAGFRLSVMATAGLLAWANPLARHLRGIGGGRMPGWLAESLGISLAAQAATLPDVLATFGRLSLVSPVVNLAVVPLVPAAMLGGVVAMLGGAASLLGAPPLVATIVGPAGLDRAPRHRGHRPVRRRRPVRRGHPAAGWRGGRRGRCRRRDPRRPGRRPRSAAPPPGTRAGVERASPAGGRRQRSRRSSDEATASGSPQRRWPSPSWAWRSATRSSGRRASPSWTSDRATRSCSRRGPAPGCWSTVAPTRIGSCWRWTPESRRGTGGSTSWC